MAKNRSSYAESSINLADEEVAHWSELLNSQSVLVELVEKYNRL